MKYSTVMKYPSRRVLDALLKHSLDVKQRYFGEDYFISVEAGIQDNFELQIKGD